MKLYLAVESTFGAVYAICTNVQETKAIEAKLKALMDDIDDIHWITLNANEVLPVSEDLNYEGPQLSR